MMIGTCTCGHHRDGHRVGPAGGLRECRVEMCCCREYTPRYPANFSDVGVGAGASKGVPMERPGLAPMKAAENIVVSFTEHATDPDDIEALAAAEHESWSGWTSYMLERLRRELEESLAAATGEPILEQKDDGSPDTTAFVLRKFDGLPCIQRWTRQMTTLYGGLPEGERESDRIEARKKLKVYRA